MDSNDHQRGKELQNIPAHTAEVAAVSKANERAEHVSPLPADSNASEHAESHDGVHQQALTHGKAASIEAHKHKP